MTNYKIGKIGNKMNDQDFIISKYWRGLRLDACDSDSLDNCYRSTELTMVEKFGLDLEKVMGTGHITISDMERVGVGKFQADINLSGQYGADNRVPPDVLLQFQNKLAKAFENKFPAGTFACDIEAYAEYWNSEKINGNMAENELIRWQPYM